MLTLVGTWLFTATILALNTHDLKIEKQVSHRLKKQEFP
jgi:hypothetical protein